MLQGHIVGPSEFLVYRMKSTLLVRWLTTQQSTNGLTILALV